jgi:hypothetical protein
MSAFRVLPSLLAPAILVACMGGQNFDNGEDGVNAAPEGTETSNDGTGQDAHEPSAEPGTETPDFEDPDDEPATEGPMTSGQAGQPVGEPVAPGSTTPLDPPPQGPAGSRPTVQPDFPGNENVGGSGPTANAEPVDAGSPESGGATQATDASLGVPSSTRDAGSTCEVNACNDHGACIERERWTLCDCDAAALPTCELPLFREIGPSRTNEELILVAVSGDGTTLVGSHVPYASEEGKRPVTWTLDEGLQFLPDDPEGETTAFGVNIDGSLISGQVLPTSGAPAFDVLWRDRVLERPAEGETLTGGTPNVRSVEEVLDLLEAADIESGYWDLWNVNDTSNDGKVVFGLGLAPERAGRWLLRLP